MGCRHDNLQMGKGGRGPPLGEEAPWIGPLLGPTELGRSDKELLFGIGLSGLEDGVEGRLGNGGAGLGGG